MRALIVGAGGFLGAVLAAELRLRGFVVDALSSREAGGIDPSSGMLPPGFRVSPGTQAVFYLAASPRSRSDPDYAEHVFAVNVLSALHVARAAARANVRRFLYASTGNVYAPGFGAFREQDPVRRDNWYALSKVHAEEALALMRPVMQVTCARLFGIYGPRQTARLLPNLVRAVLDSREVTIERRPGSDDDDGGLRISLCHVRDAARILADLAALDGVDCVNVASPESASVRQLADAIGAAAGVSPRLRHLASARESNLVADTGLLHRLLAPSFVPLTEGIREIVAEASGGGAAA